ncbi:MAG: CHAT domain-containing protein, partial [Gammaproteobacteria bacterium]
IEPIAADLTAAGARTLMLYLDGPLRYIPMAALYDGERFLIERYALVVFTEAAGDSGHRQSGDPWRLAGLGSSRAYEGFSALPAVPRELEGIVQQNDADTDGVLPGVIYLDDEFTRKAVDTVFAGQFPVIHIASHFAFRSGADINSYLLLGDGSHLTLADVRTSGYELDAVQMVTLSACETAVGDLSADGREVEGLGTLLQRQGAQAVLATLWPVADRSTGSFMQSLYRQRANHGLSKAEALRQVQLRFLSKEINQFTRGTEARGETVTGWSDSSIDKANESPASDWSHPYYWAPFILMGNWL